MVCAETRVFARPARERVVRVSAKEDIVPLAIVQEISWASLVM